MRNRMVLKGLLPCALWLAAMAGSCASANKIDMSEPTRLLGRENDVRIDAQIGSAALSERIGPSTSLPVTYEIHNFRQSPIAVADLVSETTYDDDSRTITLNVGSEVPGNELLPRLVVVAPGESKTFSTAAHMSFPVANRGELTEWPETLRVKLNYLQQVKPFEKLVGIQENAVHDPQLANDLFDVWVQNNQTVITNSVPVLWQGRPRTQNMDQPLRP